MKIQKILVNVLCCFIPIKKLRQKIRIYLLGIYRYKTNIKIKKTKYKKIKTIDSDILNKILSTYKVIFRKYDGRRFLTEVNAAEGTTEMTLKKLLDYSNINCYNSKQKLLSIGCGSRKQIEMLKYTGLDVYGVDIDVKNETEYVKWHDLNDVDDLPFENSEFDFVLAQEIIEHIENPWLLFRKVKKILKKDGIFILTTPNISSIRAKNIFVNSNFGYSTCFTKEDIWQHINPLHVFELIHIGKYNDFDILEITGNEEYFYDFIPKKNTLENRFNVTIENNDVLIFIFKNKNNLVKKYIPESTYQKVGDI